MITLGSDGEVFLSSGGSILSAVGMIGGSKDSPLWISKDIGNLQEDNVLAEFAITPCSTSSEWKQKIFTLLGEISKISDFKIKSSHKFHPEQLEHRQAREFGCNPDFNAWDNGGPNPRPDVPMDGLRTAGGHIHVGVEGMDFHQKLNLVRTMDLMLGLPSILLDPDMDRRRLYGKAGAYRDKEYGIEYRVLSNFWYSDEYLVEWVYQQTLNSVLRATAEDVTDLKIAKAINKGDQDQAMKLIKKYGVLMP